MTNPPATAVVNSAKLFDNRRQLLTVSDLAAYLQVPVETIRRWCKQGTVPVLKAGSSVRFDMDEIQEWLRGRTTKYEKKKTKNSVERERQKVLQDLRNRVRSQSVQSPTQM